jgi:hypothetical protein
MTYEKKLGTARLIFGSMAFMFTMIGWAFESPVITGVAIGCVISWAVALVATVNHNIKEAKEK